MTREDLMRLASQGEGLHLEFKQRVPAPERFAKEIAAFANTKGGYLLIGAEDDGAITGLKDAAEEEFALHEALVSHTIPIVPIELERVGISRKRDVIVVKVRESSSRPHFVMDLATGQRTAYVRIDDKSVEASPETRELMRYKGIEESILIELREKERLLLRHLENSGRITVHQFARIAGISRDRASKTLIRLTRADVLEHHADLVEDYFTHGKNLGPYASGQIGGRI